MGLQHFACNECFDEYVQAAATDDLQQLQMREGRVCCPGCAALFGDADIAGHVSSATFEKYVSARLRLVEQRLAAQSEAELKARIADELARLEHMDHEQRKIRLACRHIEEDVLTLKCPRCAQAYVDFTGARIRSFGACRRRTPRARADLRGRRQKGRRRG